MMNFSMFKISKKKTCFRLYFQRLEKNKNKFPAKFRGDFYVEARVICGIMFVKD